MSADPWSRPTVQELHAVLESIEKHVGSSDREVERLELAVPAEITTARGNTLPAMTREVSRIGIGLLHRGAIRTGQVTIKMASETREFTYNVIIEWCHPCDNGMFMSGGTFLKSEEDE